MLRAVSLLALVLVLSAPACSGRRGPAPPPAPQTRVRVENRKFLDINVYVYNGTQRIRLGEVPGVSTRTFTIPENLIFGMSNLRFQADPVGAAETPVSQEILVRAGDTVTLVVR